MARSAAWLLSAIMLLGPSIAGAADVDLVRPARGPIVVEAAPPIVVESEVIATGPLRPPPNVRYGCQRVWRCDLQVCEWRRGCWGVYGYVEGPYYTSAFARRQWQAHGLPGPSDRRR